MPVSNTPIHVSRNASLPRKVFHFFLTVPGGRFADSKAIYDEMVRSYRLGS